MELNRYQEEALDRFDRWLDAINKARADSEEAAAVLRQKGFDTRDVTNYPKKAWDSMVAASDAADTYHIDRFDGANRPIPHACFKIPTGGGKTLVAGAALERLNMQTGLILWVVPTNKIYQQTKDALRRRESPIRQRLERTSGRRVKFLEKDDEFNKHDVEKYLCVMLLSLGSVNRNRNKNFLHLNRDAGRYQTFFLDTDDVLGNTGVLERCPDLDFGTTGIIRRSLANVFRMLRPVVILDEAHKAYGKASGREYADMINRLDPRMVIEMSATPNQGISNLLVDVLGTDLWKEEMIKMPIHLNVQSDSDWKHLLDAAHANLMQLESDAKSLHFKTGRYIRPIALVRVERTGRNQRDAGHIHAETARDYLMKNLSVPSEHIAVQSSEQKELDTIGNLLSETVQVRWIITKDALKEGWDCPFAYELVILDNIKAHTTVTQLLGRVLRQPGANRTEVESLDRCYVYCNNPDTGLMAEYVKKGLDEVGLGDMAGTVRSIDEHADEQVVKKQFRHQGRTFLPLVLHKDGGKWVKLEYARHILSRVNFATLDSPDPSAFSGDPHGWTMWVISLDGTVADGSELEAHAWKTVSLSDFSFMISDIIPNVWQAARVAQNFTRKLCEAGKTDLEIYNGKAYLVKALRDHVAKMIDEMAEAVFRDKVKSGDIRFDLKMGDGNYEVKTYDVVEGTLLTRDSKPVQRSLFEQVYKEEFDTNLELNFAKYLDAKTIVEWWHRVAARQSGGYHLAGWKKRPIYPDFIAMTNEAGDKVRLGIYDTKGEHLEGSQDTMYKKDVFEALEGAFNCGKVTIHGSRMRGEFRLVFEDKFEEILA